MTDHLVYFFDSDLHQTDSQPVRVPTGTLLSEAAKLASVEIVQPCGGQGRCGRCVVQVIEGTVRRRSALRLSSEDIQQGYALACQSVIESDIKIVVPPQEKIERRLTTDRVVAEVSVPEDYDPLYNQLIRRISLRLNPPNLEDQTDDWSRLLTELHRHAHFSRVDVPLVLLQEMGETLRQEDWKVTAVLDLEEPQHGTELHGRLVALFPGIISEYEPLWSVAVDIGTTTVTIWLVDLVSGKVEAQVAEYNGQIARGEDVISRIIYAAKDGGREEMQTRIVETINQLVEIACRRVNATPREIIKATVSGNSTMIHLFLGIPATSIRLSPFITGINNIPPISAQSIRLNINPGATVDCLPGVASYVGADITAGVLASGIDSTDKLTLFIDVGTNGEIVLGNRDWLVTCACSAGPAFEGAGMSHGMRATRGAIEEVWISGATTQKPYEPTIRVIGGGKPRGLCGSGLIALISEMYLTGIIDKAGQINLTLSEHSPRIRKGEHGQEYVIAWGSDAEHGEDIVITYVDIDNLKRAKAAIYAGFSVLAESVGVSLELVDQVLIGGSFGKYINVEKAIQIGLLPDMSWDRFQFLGNTSVRGAYYALLDWRARQRVQEIAARMTYIELSADNAFYEAFMSAMFFPHTDIANFPSVAAAIERSPL
jgi:uncharacterized 2Fe-2S/4Fe-4S cluster protein (DUF4445 family)